MAEPFPKLKLFQLSRYVMDLFMVREGNETSISEPKVRLVWHLLFFSVWGSLLIALVVGSVLRQATPHSILATYIWRSVVLALFLYLLLLLYIMAYRYYVFLLRTGKDLQFKNIAFFYLAGVALYGNVYQSLFKLAPSLFRISDSTPAQAGPNLGDFSLYLNVVSTLEFILYSVCVITSVEHPSIKSASSIVTTINVTEVVYGLIVMALFVATFVQKSASERKR